MRTLLPARWLVLALAACNAPPGQPQIAINPGQPDTLADLQVLFLADTPDDNEKDLVAHSFQWFEDGSLRTDLTTDTVPAAETDKGETWRVVVTPNDGDVDGEVAEAQVTILDAPPSLNVTLEPQAPYTDDDLVARATGDDADGDDVTFRYAWTRDGAPQELDAFTVPAALTAHGETWEVTVTPIADELEGLPVVAAVVIGNTPPTLDAVQLTPEAPTVADVLQAIPALPDDLDGDNVTLTYDWTVNGALVQSGTSDLLDASQFQKHDQVQVTATPDDGLALGAPVQSDLVEVQNARPTATDVTVAPSPLREGDIATCSPAGFADLDGDPEGWIYTWTVDGLVVGDQPTLDSAAFQKGQDVVCTVQPDDGESLGAPLDSALVAVVNTPPVLTAVTLSTLAPTENDTLTATLGVGLDADGDPITYGYEWFVNGSSVSFATSLPSSRFDKGDQIVLRITPFDGEALGAPIDSATAVAVNTPPALTAVSITPADLFTNTVALANPVVTDLDGDTVTYTYDWFVDGFPRGSALSPSLAGSSFFDKDQSVYVVVTPFDGEDYGQPLQSPVEVVLNTPPTAPVVQISPADPQPGDTLTCAIVSESTDADGDTINYAFDWAVNGQPHLSASDQGTTSVVSGHDVANNTTWTCQAEADDGYTATLGLPSSPVSVGLLGSVADIPGLSCRNILEEGDSVGDGMYWIDPNGGDHSDAALVGCNMTTDGGGWTRLFVAPSANENSTSLNYTYDNQDLRSAATQTLIGYVTADGFTLLSNRAIFPQPAGWVTQAPFRQANAEEVIVASVDGGPATISTLKYGYENFNAGDCTSSWLFTYDYGRICLTGLAAPFYSGFAYGATNADLCSVSDGPYNATSCSSARQFSIWAR